MTRVAFFLALIFISACTTLAPAERKARIPNIPVEAKDCESPLGLIRDGESKKGFLNQFEPVGRSCQSGELICHDGTWSGEFVHGECRPGLGSAGAEDAGTSAVDNEDGPAAVPKKKTAQ